MSDEKPANVINLADRLKGQKAGDVDAGDLVETLKQVINANLEPRVTAEVTKAIAPLRSEIEKLRESLTRVAAQVEQVRMGKAGEAGLVLTDDKTASVTLATARVAQEERYPYSTVSIAERIAGKPSTGRVATVIGQLGLKGDKQYWCELKVGSTSFNRYSNAALERVVAAFADPAQHLPPESPAFRTVMNFLEGV